MEAEELKALAIESLKAEGITPTMDATIAWMLGYETHVREEIGRHETDSA